MSTDIRKIHKCLQCRQMSEKIQNVHKSAKISSNYPDLMKMCEISIGVSKTSINVKKCPLNSKNDNEHLKFSKMSSNVHTLSFNLHLSDSWCFWRARVKLSFSDYISDHFFLIKRPCTKTQFFESRHL